MADRRSRTKAKGTKRTTAPSTNEAPSVLGNPVHGWTILAHDLLLDQLGRLRKASEKEHRRGLGDNGPATKLLGHVLDLVFDSVPRDPANPAYRHGGTLGGGNREWFRAKTGNGRYRLFFRFHSTFRVIIFAWLNDEESLRTYGSSTDAYAVFAGMLDSGNPPSSWEDLLKIVNTQQNVTRLNDLGKSK